VHDDVGGDAVLLGASATPFAQIFAEFGVGFIVNGALIRSVNLAFLETHGAAIFFSFLLL